MWALEVVRLELRLSGPSLVLFLRAFLLLFGINLPSSRAPALPHLISDLLVAPPSSTLLFFLIFVVVKNELEPFADLLSEDQSDEEGAEAVDHWVEADEEDNLVWPILEHLERILF